MTAQPAPHRAIVTGGSRGIGRAIVTRLLADNAQVVTCGRGTRPQDLPPEVTWVQADIANPQQATNLLHTATQTFGAPTLLINNAGVQIEKTLPDSTDADWDTLIGVNCRGVFNMCRATIPLMPTGAIINIGSISGTTADPSMALYNASKAFVHGLTRSIAVDHGPNIRCNAICPGWIMTDMAQSAFARAADPAAAQADALKRHPAGRFGRPEDIAGMVAYLASPEAAFVTGACLTLDGGMTAASPLQPGLF